MKMRWVLQNNIFNEVAYDQLIATLERFGLEVYQRRVVPFVGVTFPLGYEGLVTEDYVDHELVSLGSNVICFGSYSMRHTSVKYGWKPGVFDIIETGNFENCYKHWGNLLLNGDSRVVAFKDGSWPLNEVRFIRPTDDSKHFAGKLMTGAEFMNWQNGVCSLGMDQTQSLSPETQIQVARPKNIYMEYRCWVIKGCIVTTSLYKRGDRVTYQNVDDALGDTARDFANNVLNMGWQPHEAFCLDVCETDEGWRIVEVNTLNSCGFYAANLTSLVLSLEEAFDAVS